MKLAVIEKQNIPAALKKAVVLKRRNKESTMRDTGLLVLRLTTGGLIAGHGAQMLFGWFGGSGLKGTAAIFESIGLKPGTPWATAASASEFGGGVLTALGFLHPLGPMGTMGAMVMATAKAHWGKPIWATKGGAELPLINIATAFALTLTGPGRFSLDRLFGIRLPRALVIAAAVVEGVLLTIGITSQPTPPPESPVKRQVATTVATS
jgi:putative oxidoreductase